MTRLNTKQRKNNTLNFSCKMTINISGMMQPSMCVWPSSRPCTSYPGGWVSGTKDFWWTSTCTCLVASANSSATFFSCRFRKLAFTGRCSFCRTAYTASSSQPTWCSCSSTAVVVSIGLTQAASTKSARLSSGRRLAAKWWSTTRLTNSSTFRKFVNKA